MQVNGMTESTIEQQIGNGTANLKWNSSKWNNKKLKCSKLNHSLKQPSIEDTVAITHSSGY